MIVMMNMMIDEYDQVLGLSFILDTEGNQI